MSRYPGLAARWAAPLAALAATALLQTACATGGAPGAQQSVVDRAALTVQDMMTQTVSQDPKTMLRNAKGAMICPRIFKAGFFFGGEGVIADNDPLEQEKAVKYNDLVANAVIFHNVVEQTRIIKTLMRAGWKITQEDVAALSPYVTSHVKRFGDYLIDVDDLPEPYEIELALIA